MTSNAPAASPVDAAMPWGNTFATLGAAFYTHLPPSALPEPYWVGHSTQLAHQLGLGHAVPHGKQWLQAFSGNHVPSGTQPLASVYSGHQFGVWAGQLGDGRALLLGELAGHEIQLKGAGRTPYSRMGDGRAVLRSSIREFLASEAMHGLGIPTTRALCVTGSDTPVRRETIETAAVVTRVASSFIRFGHFEHFSHNGLHQELRALADFVIERHYPACRTDPRLGHNPYANLLAAVSERTAQLVAHWQAVGFCHGVMNTDNMSILGLTLDYGPFQFMDAFDPEHICNHSDTQGRYAFCNQPAVARWNLFCLGHALLPLIDDQDLALAALETFQPLYAQAFTQRMSAKLGFANPDAALGETLRALAQDVLGLLAAQRVDYTIFWRRLSHWARERSAQDTSVRELFPDPSCMDRWLPAFSSLLAQAPAGQGASLMLQFNPKYVLRNHLGELAIRAAKTKDFSVVANLLKVLESPYDEHPEHAAFADFAPDWAQTIAISCSS